MIPFPQQQLTSSLFKNKDKSYPLGDLPSPLYNTVNKLGKLFNQYKKQKPVLPLLPHILKNDREMIIASTFRNGTPLARKLLKHIVLPFYALQPAIPHPLILQNPICTTFILLYEMLTSRTL
jgi:hypothetical protein